MKKRVYSGTTWEEEIAYCRAIRVGNTVTVSGTTAVDDNGETVFVNDMYGQTIYIFKKIERALKELNFSLSDIVRTRMFVTNIKAFDDVGRAHKIMFNGIDPTATCVEITRLVKDDLLIEIEVDAMADNNFSN
jgi:enamine deaminase RidA (YjgF/YER057c/UK114 family)